MPPSQLAWLDYSEDDQRRAREIIALFSQRESRDELGIGVIRDALSEALFPGTSVLLTRARYFLFVPWLFMEGSRRGHSGPQLTGWVDWQERRLIEALRRGGDTQGLVGAQVGAAVRNLPSTIYWNSLRRFGVLRHGGTPAQVAGVTQRSRGVRDATELVERVEVAWDPAIPSPPTGFFEMQVCDFALTREEANWLVERIVEATPETLLANLVANDARPTEGADYPWDEPHAHQIPASTREILNEARRFALLMHGAAMLYNVLLAERAEQLGLSLFDSSRDRFASDLEQWEWEVNKSDDLRGWETNALWALVVTHASAASARTRDFVEQWLALVRTRAGAGLAGDAHARALVEQRELLQKGGQARLRNDRLMRQWGGASGYARLNYRWPVVGRLLRDLADGRERGSAGT